jgi:malto-oligosyltrehalose synthase/4-alpha-glucanotransferase
MHGYDVTNPLRLNPELGNRQILEEIHEDLTSRDMGWLQDIVPNHMAYHPSNEWINDIFSRGEYSPYFHFFDISWKSYKNAAEKKVMAPFLGKPLEKTIADKETYILWIEGMLFAGYYEHQYPLYLPTYREVLQASPDPIPEKLVGLIKEIDFIDLSDDDAMKSFVSSLQHVYLKDAKTKKYIHHSLNAINTQPEKLLEILSKQYFEFCYWKKSEKTMNYRRFFTINDLICLRMEDEKVFDEYHSFIKEWMDKNIFQGARVDHVDGLRDPAGYLAKLRRLAGEGAYILTEKILEKDERIPGDWPVQGTTGYDFLAKVNNLFVQQENRKFFDGLYRKFTSKKKQFDTLLHEKKAFILWNRMAGELENLTQQLLGSGLLPELVARETEAVKEAIASILVYCPVYRLYFHQLPLEGENKATLLGIFQKAAKEKPTSKPVIKVLENIYLHDYYGDNEIAARNFLSRCMQFTGPLMAKGFEDTTMYVYNRFTGTNEVGDSPGHFGISVEEFHQHMKERQQSSPYSMNATASHDTKRGEDVRARLAALTDKPREWKQKVEEWEKMNLVFKKIKENQEMPDKNDEYFIYQTLSGIMPMDLNYDEALVKRANAYLVKALREAKENSSWSQPDQEYEQATRDFVTNILKPGTAFMKSFQEFVKKLVDPGIMNSLSQVLLKYTCPGIPDNYQGTELWDLSLVDPDNRRPVDYGLREKILDELLEEHGENTPETWGQLWKKRHDGQIKLWLVHNLLKIRKKNPGLFTAGEYIPLQVKGKHARHLLAFARQERDRFFITVLPLHLPGQSIDWNDTRVVLPDFFPRTWAHILTGEEIGTDKALPAKELFKNAGLGALSGKRKENQRGAGVLLHISSLPGKHGVGDIGPGAYRFADWLAQTGQKMWQLLPLGPIDERQSYSPYSALSAFAGNPLFISPELLLNDRLLKNKDMASLPTRENKNTVDYPGATATKRKLLQRAFRNFIESPDHGLQAPFETFMEKESHWLDDFATFMILKEEHQDKPWNQWPDEYKLRNEESLQAFREKHAERIREQKFYQYLFFKQWLDLKAYCNRKNISVFGDLPIYVAYDSADVWAHPNYFKLDENREMEKVAGVPPDYFSETGQLWGMPVYDWENVKNDGFRWWVERVRQNFKLYDMIRIDHFRGFSAYWEVGASEKTAVNGKWVPGPGTGLFDKLREELGNKCIVAEDLGVITPDVVALKNHYQFPGMKILQFGFNQRWDSGHIPHHNEPNSVVYTGTHDNNTLIGWYKQELDKATRQRISKYMGKRLRKSNVNEHFIKMAYISTANWAIVPMQDILKLDEKSRMNKPSTVGANWAWKMQDLDIGQCTTDFLKELVVMGDRV